MERFATEGDAAELVALFRHLSSQDHPGTEAQAAAMLRQLALWPGSGVVVAGDPIAASCTLIVAPNLSRGGQPWALIENVVTSPSQRRQGLGHAVLRFAIERAWEAGCYKVMLMTGRSDPGIHAFYEGAGFAQSKTGFQIRRR
ncbi:MAG: GNAT family N-acetyltransferase [Rhodobacterales bacterium]|nr:MAG: GNAT family N-acetyltransferase [Rhodobacterales bacterium]